GAVAYNIACAYALKGNSDRAFEYLKLAVEKGFDVVSYLRHDDDLDSLRSDPRWTTLKNDSRAAKSSQGHAAKDHVARLERLLAKQTREEPGGNDGAPFHEVGRNLLED